MKLESLNNSKYSLTPEKMGELVGGAIRKVCTDGGAYNSQHGWSSADHLTYYSGTDVHNGIVEDRHDFWGANDVANRDRIYSNCSCAVGK